MDRGEYDACTYCGKSIFPGVAECPYCQHYTDGQGPFGLEEKKRLPRIFVIAGWLVLAGMLLPLLLALWSWLRS